MGVRRGARHRQHQLVVSRVVLDHIRAVVAEEFAAVIRTHVLGNDAAVDRLGHADAVRAALQTVSANGDVGAPIQIHIAVSLVHCVPRDGRPIGHGEGGSIADTHTVADVAGDAGGAVHVELAG